MKWDDDYYFKEKWQIFDIMKNGLRHDTTKHITVFALMLAIDHLFEELTDTEMDESEDADQDDEHYESPDPIRTQKAKIICGKEKMIDHNGARWKITISEPIITRGH